LITCPTGGGKSLPGEFAMNYFVSKNKKVIYTSPIKALSNQKFYEYTTKYPHISFGIITGDIKINPNADVLIMTAEILLNKLYNKEKKDFFDINIEDDLACVIFDEIHFINDRDRGHVWEEIIMLLPKHIQMVMLSATLDNPEKFAKWCEKSDKIVYLSTVKERIVPLTHYSFITTTNSIFKNIKDKNIHNEINSIINKPIIIQDPKNMFNEINYNKINKTIDMFRIKKIFIKRQFVLNQVLKYCMENEMLPALCFVLSRKKVEQFAQEINTNLFIDENNCNNVRRECEKIIRKLPNHKEYLNLPEYINLVSLLEKGIAIHHAGVVPVLREMVEILYSLGYVKVLFATETFSVGLNMPTKTVIFTDIIKWDGSDSRLLLPHEYTQMAGRAGRRGIDTVGNVIHLNNLYQEVDKVEFRLMLKGRPQELISKFKFSYNFILNSLTEDMFEFVKNSIYGEEIKSEIDIIKQDIKDIQNIIEKNNNIIFTTPDDIIIKYLELEKELETSKNKKKREIKDTLENIANEYKNIKQDIQKKEKIEITKEKQEHLYSMLYDAENYINTNIKIILDILKNNDFIMDDNNLIMKGIIAKYIKEVHCLVFAEIINKKIFDKLTSKQLASLFSCMTSINVCDEIRNDLYSCKSDIISELQYVSEYYTYYYEKELEVRINTGSDYNIQYDIINYVIEWCECKDEIQCKMLLNKILREKDISVGDFSKALLKINNIAKEMENVANLLCDNILLQKLQEIPNLICKYVVTNQSLYV